MNAGQASGMFDEVEDFLNDRDARGRRRREHHLPREAYAQTDQAFFLTLCARHHGEPFWSRPLAGAVIEAMEYRRRRSLWWIYTFCLMPDHLHFVVQLRRQVEPAPSKDLLTLVAEFKSITTRAAWREGLKGKLWQHDQYDSALRSGPAFDNRCHYVLNNPVRKGLVVEWTDWPYSGIPDSWEIP